MELPRRLLPILALALLGSAHALDAGGLAPALEATFPTSVAYLDCPYASAARTCVLVPNAGGVRAANRTVLDFLRSRPGVEEVKKESDGAYTLHAGDTAYRLHVAPSRARPGMVAATLSFAFDESSATHAVCLRPNALFDFARLPSLTAGQYGSMATAITCHGADPTDPQGRTPLSGAVRSGNLAAVRTLLRGGADPNHISDSGWTPLLTAGKLGTRPILDALLQAGGDPTYVAPDGATVAALRPFNPQLAAAPGAPGGDAVLPELPGSLPAGGTLALANPAPRAVRAQLAHVSATPNASEQADNAVLVEAAAPSQTQPGTNAKAIPVPVAAHAPAPATVREPRSRGGRVPLLPLGAVLAALAVVLALLRIRTREVGRHEALRDTGTEWRALSRPKPLTRRRRARRLEPASPWNDPLA